MDPHSRPFDTACLPDSIRGSASVVCRRGRRFFRRVLRRLVLDRIMEDACFPEFEVIFGLFIVRELEQLDSDAVTCRHVSNPELVPSCTKDIRTHDTDGRVIFEDIRWFHDDIPTHHLLIKTDGFVEIRYRKTDVRKITWIRYA